MDGSPTLDIVAWPIRFAEMRFSRALPRACSATTTSREAAKALEPGTSATLLVYETAVTTPFAKAGRQSGGQLVANGRIPVQALLAAIEETEGAIASVLDPRRTNRCQDFIKA